MNKEQPEAIRLAELIDHHAPIDFDGHLAQAAAELRRLSADGEAKDRRIAHLEATASANYGRGHADAHSMLSERIAELEQRNSDLHEDVQRFKKHALNEKAARMELERQLEEARNQALEEAANGAEALAKKWWARHCETNRHMETTREAHEDFCQLGRAIRALKGAKE